MTNYFIIICAAILFINVSCKTKNANFYKTDNIVIEWELISNNYSENPQAKAAFNIKNESKYTFKSDNWVLHFNQTPRRILAINDSLNTQIKHINGDYYKLLPKDEFILKPGDSIKIIYEMEGWLIKETDAPAGLYFCFYDKETEKENIVSVKNYHIKPFLNQVQFTRHKNDNEPNPTPEWQYLQNQNIKQLPGSLLLEIIPSPVKMLRYNNNIIIDSTYIIYHDKILKKEAEYLANKLKQLCGIKFNLSTNDTVKEPVIKLLLKDIIVNGISNESYELDIKHNHISLTGNDKAGLFYAIQSFLSLIPLENYKFKKGIIELKKHFIADAPRFQFRSMHIDVSRNFQSKEELLRIIDLLSFYKLNTLLLHLTDDEGWRLEIEELPELTTFGAFRGHSINEEKMLQPSFGSGPFANADNNGCGYYSREDFIEIIKYANDRYVKIIPSVNMPGHARAAIKAMEYRYKKYIDLGKEKEANKYRLIDPDDKSIYYSAQSYNDNVVNVALESTYSFYKVVINDIIEMYNVASVPFDFLHSGGDEVPNGAWEKSDACKKLMAELNIKEAKNLQQYFFKRILSFLESKLLTIGGWEEVVLQKNEQGELIVNSEFVSNNVVPFIWNNLWGAQDLGYKIANKGYPIIQCNVSNFYFDLAYNNDPKEPGLYWAGFVNERNPWEFMPYDVFRTTTKTSMGRIVNTDIEYEGMERLNPESYKNILGLQAQLWSETVKGPEMLEYYLLPKLISFAERCWSKAPTWENINDEKERKIAMDEEWNIFINSVSTRELPKLNYLNDGYNYRVPPPGAMMENDTLKANCQYPSTRIYYTLDGSEPDTNSLLYTSPIPISKIVTLKAIDTEGKMSRKVQVYLK